MALIPLTNAGAVQLSYSDLSGNPTVPTIDPPIDMSNTSTWKWLIGGASSLSTSVPSDMSASSLANGYLEETNKQQQYYIVRAVASGTSTWSITAKIKIGAMSCPANVIGLVAYDNGGSNKATRFMMYQNGSMNANQQLGYVQNFTGTDSIDGGTPPLNGTGVGNRMDLWLRISANGTSMFFYTSPDGTNFHQVATQTFAAWATPTHYGFCINTFGTTSGAFLAMSCSNGTFS